MKFNTILIFDEFEQTANERILRNPLTSILVPFLPTLFSFSTYFSFYEVHTNKDYLITVEVLDPNNEVIISHSTPVQINDQKNHTNFTGSMNINFKNVQFKIEGIHSIKVYNSEHSHQFFFPVIIGS